MEHFDVLVIGSGSGMSIVDASLNKGLRVALVERDLLGGTCLNRGCIPSKMVIYPADIIQEIKRAAALGVKASIADIDFSEIMDRTRKSVIADRRHMEENVKQVEGLIFYNKTAEFIGDYTARVGDEDIQAKNIFIVSGARPDIPEIKGLEDVSYLTSRNVWDLTKAPKSMIIVGGGYIAAEMAHFFSSVGVEVIILSRSPRLLKSTDPEVSDILTQALRTRMCVKTGVEVTEVRDSKGRKEVTTKSNKGDEEIFNSESLFIATGLKSNADILKPEKTGVQLDTRGYIKVNDFYETTKSKIWAFGDAIGRAMFKHVANKEAELVWHSFDHGHKQKLDYDKIPYAVFTWPQVAVVGLTEQEATKRRLKFLIGAYSFGDTAYGMAMGEEDGFVKILLEEETYRVLGAQIVGPNAAILIQEIVNAMMTGDGSIYSVVDSMHIHPALTEVVQRASYSLHRPGHSHQQP